MGPRRNLGANLDEFIDLQKRCASTDRVSFAEGARGAMSAHEPGPARPGATVPHLVMFALIRPDVLICRRGRGRQLAHGPAVIALMVLHRSRPPGPLRSVVGRHMKDDISRGRVSHAGRLRRVLNYSLAPCQPCSADSWSTDGSGCPVHTSLLTSALYYC